MKSLLQLWQFVALDLGDRCRVSTARDYETVTCRVKDEGISFLTISLPEFGKSLERALDAGKVAPNDFLGFRKRSGLPVFLRGFLEQIFDSTSGILLDKASTDSIYAVRQLAGLFAKVELECSPRRVRAAYDEYIQCETHVREYDNAREDQLYADFHRISRILFARVFTRADSQVANFGLVPAHGPGATANGLGGNAKFDCLEWTARMDRVLPISEYLLPNVRFYKDLDRAFMREPGHEQPVKVTHVPKTLKTPRIIAEEPSYMMFMQQAFWHSLRTGLEADPLVGSLIGFTDQLPNRQMAREGSLTGGLATLDLSSASDLVSNQLVLRMLKDHPHLSDGVMACRSEIADVPGHGVIPLSKFASMGSALCFPFEAMVFLAIVLLGIERVENTPLRYKDIESLHGKVRIYGDDIIVPGEYASSVCSVLEAYGLKVNHNKSFWSGNFRESCGGDYYGGTDVTPIRVRALVPESRTDTTGVVSLVSFRNQAFHKSLFRTCEWLDRLLDSILQGCYPEVGPNASVLGRETFGPVLPDRMSPTTHAPQQRGWTAIPKLRENGVDGRGALLKFFLKPGSLPIAEREHLRYSGRPVAVTLKRRWRNIIV